MRVIILAPGAWFLAVLLILLTACTTVSQPAAASISAPPGAPSVELFVEPDDGVQPIVRFVDSSQRTLDVAMYLLSDRNLVAALERSRQRGVAVRVMLEEHPYGTGPGNRAIYDQLKKAGISVNWSPTTFQLSHDKYAVADQQVALLGTPNWTFSATRHNREYFVLDRDPTDVKQLASLFDADWQRRQATLDDPHLVISPTSSRSDFLGLIGSAQRQVDLEAEEMQDPGIEAALAQAAGRGIQVRVILPRPSAGQTDANTSGEQALSAHRVQVRTLRNPYVHAKEVVVDSREAFVGSENISQASLDKNREVGILVSDQVAIKRLNSIFARDWTAAQP